LYDNIDAYIVRCII